MRVDDLFRCLEEGQNPVVQFQEKMEEQETMFDDMMRARLVGGYRKADGMYVLHFEVKEFEAYNMPFMKGGYLGNDSLRVIDTSFYPKNGIEEVYWYLQDGEIPLELVDMSPLYTEYRESKSNLTYVQWLEAQLLAFR